MSEEFNSPSPETGNSGTGEAGKETNMDAAAIPAASESKRSNKFRIYTPVIISAVILLVSVLVFCGWKLFFDKSLLGDWTMTFVANGKDQYVTLSFEKDDVCCLHVGGITHKGKYSLEEDDSGNQMIKTNFNESGKTYLVANFRYSISGNEASGKKLSLTDLSGFIYPPDVIATQDEEQVKTKQAAADYIEEKGVRYYIINFESNNSYSTPIKHFESENTDSKLTGIWLYTDDNSNYDYTFAFYDDNTYQITYRDYLCNGCYTAGNGKCVFNIAGADGSIENNSNELKYSFEGDKLVLTFNDVPATLTKTDSEYAFDNGIK